MKKLLIFILSVSLSACSISNNHKPAMVVDKDMLVGTWHCIHSTNKYSNDAKTTYLTNGILSETSLFSFKKPEIDGDFLYELSIEGTWELKGNIVFQHIDSIKLEPQNELSFAFNKMLQKVVEGKKKSYLTIVTINNSTFNAVRKGGKAQSCDKIID